MKRTKNIAMGILATAAVTASGQVIEGGRAVEFGAAGQPVGGSPVLDLGISDDPSYQAFRAAVEKAALVRVDYSLAEHPRAVAVVAGLHAFASRNPGATIDDLRQFRDAYNAALASFYPADDRLNRASHFMAALRLNECAVTPGLDGRVGQRVRELLGVDVGAPADFLTTQSRMIEYENSRSRSFVHSRIWFQLLTLGFYGRDVDGNPNPDLPVVIEEFLVAEGFEPTPVADGDDDSRFNDALAGVAAMPTDFAGYAVLVGEVAPDGSNLDDTTLQNTIAAGMGNVQALNTDVLSRIQQAGCLPGIEEAANNAGDPAFVLVTLAEYEADLIALARDRVTVSWNAMLLAQSDSDAAVDYADKALQTQEVQLETNQTLERINQSLQIAGGVALIAYGVKTGEPDAAISGAIYAVSGSLNLADSFGSGQSPEEQLFDQIQLVRADIADLKIEMTDRFDRVDQQLNILYNEMLASFDALTTAFGGLSADIDDLNRAMIEQRAVLDRIEDALWGFASDLLLVDLASVINQSLDRRDRFGVDLPYDLGTPDFVDTSIDLRDFATLTAGLQAFAGAPEGILTGYEGASSVLFDNPDTAGFDASLGRNVNELRTFPSKLSPPLPELALTPVVSGAPWAQAAAAYAQLARENPWYFAFALEQQDQSGSPTDLDRIIGDGEALVAMMTAGHDQALFDKLFEDYAIVQDAILSVEAAELEAEKIEQFGPLSEPAHAIDLFGDLDQPLVVGELPTAGVDLNGDGYFLTVISSAGGNAQPLPMPNGSTSWGLFDVRSETAGACGPLSQKNVYPIAYALQLAEAERTNGPSFADYGFSLQNAGNGFSIVFDADWSSQTQLVRFRRTVDFAVYWNFETNRPDPDMDDLEFFLFEQQDVWNTVRQQLLNGESVAGTTVFTNAFDPDFPDTRVSLRIDFLTDTVDPALADDARQTVDAELMRIKTGLWTRLRDNACIASGACGGPVGPGLGQQLEDIETVIDAYITMSMPDLFERSTVIQSALRGAPFPGSLALGINAVDYYSQNLLDPNAGVLLADQFGNARTLAKQSVDEWLTNSPTRHGYLDWMLSELHELRANAARLAIDDSYNAEGTLAVSDPDEGVLANDVLQTTTPGSFRTLAVDSYTQPSNGTVSVNLDGTFTYTPDSGFSGSDTFTYVATTNIGFAGGDPISLPATVRVRVVTASCVADINTKNVNPGDPGYGEPDGTVDGADLSYYVEQWLALSPVADTNTKNVNPGDPGYGIPDGTIDGADLSYYVEQWLAGCP